MLIQKIREKIWWVILGVGIAMVIFILQMAFDSKTGVTNNKMGTVAGEDIEPQYFNEKYTQAETNYKQQNNTSSIDNNTSWSLRQQVWDQIINEKVLRKIYDKTGIAVGSDELNDMFYGENPHQAVKQYFADPTTGIVDKTKIVQAIKNTKKNPDQQKAWIEFEDYLRKDREYSKFTTLLQALNYTPSWLAKETFKEQNQTVNAKYVLVPYTKVDDKNVTLTDADYENYISRNSSKYKQEEETRVVEFVSFKLEPSLTDRQNLMTKLASLKAEFASTKEDSAFVSRNSDSPFDESYLPMNKFTNFVKDTIGKLAVGAVFGPYMEGNTIKLSKVMGKKTVPDSVKSRHILISAKTPEEIAKANTKMDSIKSLITSGKIPFDMAAKTFSDDKSNSNKGGDLGYAAQGMFVKPFNDGIFFEHGKGEMFKVTTQFGVHLVQVMDSKNPSLAVQLATVSNELTPSSETARTVFSDANEFAGKYRNADDFKKGVAAKDLVSSASSPLKITDYQVGNLGAAREIVRWAFNDAKKGDVSSVFNLDDKYVVALLKDVRPKGKPSVESLREELKAKVTNIKKYEQIASAVKGMSIDQIASKYGVEVKDAANVSFQSPYIPNLGFEPSFSGSVFATGSGKTTSPIQGNSGVIVAKVESVSDMKNVPTPENVQNPILSGIMGGLQLGLKDIGKVKDNRGKML